MIIVTRPLELHLIGIVTWEECTRGKAWKKVSPAHFAHTHVETGECFTKYWFLFLVFNCGCIIVHTPQVDRSTAQSATIPSAVLRTWKDTKAAATAPATRAPPAMPPFDRGKLSTPTACGLLAVGDLGLAWRGKQSRWTWGVGRDEFRLNNRLGTGRFFSEMQKVSDAADISVLFFQMVLVFEKATCKTDTGASSTQCYTEVVLTTPVLLATVLSKSVLSASVLHSSSATNASVLFMVDWQFTVFCRKVEFVVIYAFLVLIFCGNICVCPI